VVVDATSDNYSLISAFTINQRETDMRSLLLLFLGVPLPIIILIALFSH
jgi:hypothetical protein